MAALMKHEPLLRVVKLAFNCGNVVKYSKAPPKRPPPQRTPPPKLYGIDEATAQSLEAKGYLRPLKAYTPPENVEEQVQSTLSSVLGGEVGESTRISDPTVRFKVLEACYKTFDHGVPNSLLHSVNSVGDIVEFYKTPVDPATPIEILQRQQLPPNLHIQSDYKRFEEGDPMFNGVSAFPKSPTLVTGLKARKKYKSTEAQNWSKDWREHALGYTQW